MNKQQTKVLEVVTQNGKIKQTFASVKLEQFQLSPSVVQVDLSQKRREHYETISDNSAATLNIHKTAIPGTPTLKMSFWMTNEAR